MPAGPSSGATEAVWLGPRGAKEEWSAGARTGSPRDLTANNPKALQTGKQTATAISREEGNSYQGRTCKSW